LPFIIRIYHDARSSECQIASNSTIKITAVQICCVFPLQQQLQEYASKLHYTCILHLTIQ